MIQPGAAASADSSNDRRAPWREFAAGARAVLPILLGVMPFGLIFGALAVSSGASAAAAQAMSAVIFAGSAQFIATELIAQGTPWLVVILTAAVVNVRHVLYSASIAPHLRALPARWKAALAYLLTDEAYAVAIGRYLRPDGGGPYGRYFFLGAGLALWLTWQISTAAGITLGAFVPAAWSLDFALPLTFIAIIVPSLRDRPAVITAAVAAAIAVVAYAMPLKLGLLTAVACGITAGLVAERALAARTRPEEPAP